MYSYTQTEPQKKSLLNAGFFNSKLSDLDQEGKMRESTLTPEEEQIAFTMYYQQASDAQIARRLNLSTFQVRYWRQLYNLPSIKHASRLTFPGVPMEEALSSEQCAKMRWFIRILLTYWDLCRSYRCKPDITQFLKEFRKMQIEGSIDFSTQEIVSNNI